jgi:hypothetical protein
LQPAKASAHALTAIHELRRIVIKASSTYMSGRHPSLDRGGRESSPPTGRIGRGHAFGGEDYCGTECAMCRSRSPFVKAGIVQDH